TSGPRGCEGREQLGLAGVENFSSGHLGQRDAEDADSRRSREPITLHHVSSVAKGQGSPFEADRRNLSQAVWNSWAVRTRGT
ncbi:hypothetical protein KI387_011382, partial [Taxus chinensis]